MRASLARQFLLAWAIGVAALVLAAAVDDRFAALFVVSGVMLLLVAVRALTNDRAWERLRARLPIYTRSDLGRLWFGTGVFMLGSGWLAGGAIGLLLLFGYRG
jgi:hypothetical protein